MIPTASRRCKIPLVLFVGAATLGSCFGYFPFGLGHRVHVCGEIVDENMIPLKDTLQLEISVTRPMMDLKGNLKISRYADTITNSRFCLNSVYCEHLIASLSGERIVPSSMSVKGRSFFNENYKWVVERRARPLKRPYASNWSLATPKDGIGDAFSVWGDRIFWNADKSLQDTISMKTARIVSSVVGIPFDEDKLDASRIALSRAFRQTIREVRGYHQFLPLFEFQDSRALAAFYLVSHGDSLFFRAGPFARPRFAEATLDSPACYFGRMADPPPKESPLWRDSLLIAAQGKVVPDGFYLYLPWTDTWGKAVFDTVLRSETGSHSIRFALLTEPYGKTDSFEFMNLEESRMSNPYYARRKCFTKMEKLTRDVYPTRIRPGVKVPGIDGSK